jgi:hypothetical protein
VLLDINFGAICEGAEPAGASIHPDRPLGGHGGVSAARESIIPISGMIRRAVIPGLPRPYP